MSILIRELIALTNIVSRMLTKKTLVLFILFVRSFGEGRVQVSVGPFWDLFQIMFHKSCQQ